MNRLSLAVLSLSAIALLVLSPTIARADDSTIDLYTGNFPVFGGVTYYPGQPTAATIMSYNDLQIGLTFQINGNVTDFQETPYCGLGCPQYYSANIDSGTVQFSGTDYSGQTPPYQFTGLIAPGGTLTGDIVCDNQGCAWDDHIDLTFQSTSGTNGWMSSGSLSYTDGNDGSGGGGYGNLNLLTQQASAPEPSSFLLFGSGVAGLGAWLRRKQS